MFTCNPEYTQFAQLIRTRISLSQERHHLSSTHGNIAQWPRCSSRRAAAPQFYRVEVKVLPPSPDAAPRSRSVLRRFSHFQKLYQIVSPFRV